MLIYKALQIHENLCGAVHVFSARFGVPSHENEINPSCLFSLAQGLVRRFPWQIVWMFEMHAE